MLLAVPTAAAGAIGGAWWMRGSSGATAETAAAPSAGPASPTGRPAASPSASGVTVIPAGPAVVTQAGFRSAARGQNVSLVVVSPVVGSVEGLPVCLVLHGRGDDARRGAALLGLDSAVADAVRSGAAPFVAVAVDGGETYWHRRVAGDDPERMILAEVLPRLAAQGLRTSRVAAFGWSMGGYGALLLSERHPDLVVAVAASSPAMWRTYGASAPGAFDSAADFGAHQVLGEPPAAGVAYRIDCGRGDPFYTVSRQSADELAAGERAFGPGGHDPTFWRAALPAQLAFVARALAAPANRPTPR
ncbi:alpha/beta hydrolase-fold protein [Pseudofrankia sp. DC12]|uniref:alpha/beta hydrolase n=1 Tax=Pseudofrankia sp. DC12 TaxID=683315 RepID=UPI000698B197|nr:alpha/beta hydrolase-fold protein [Pseudofrankia sp. DC12]